MTQISLDDATTHLSSLVDRAAAGEAGEEVLIPKNGVPLARLGPLPTARLVRVPANALGVSVIAEDFDAVDLEIVALFGGVAHG